MSRKPQHQEAPKASLGVGLVRFLQEFPVLGLGRDRAGRVGLVGKVRPSDRVESDEGPPRVAEPGGPVAHGAERLELISHRSVGWGVTGSPIIGLQLPRLAGLCVRVRVVLREVGHLEIGAEEDLQEAQGLFDVSEAGPGQERGASDTGGARPSSTRPRPGCT